MKSFATSILMLLAVALVGCSQVSVNQNYDPEFDFSGYKTYQVAPYDASMGFDEITYGQVKRAVEDNLNAKGLKETDTSPDFSVEFASAKQRQTEINQMGPGWWNTDVYQYEEGTLLVDVKDAKSGKLVWRGTGQGELPDNPSMEQRQEMIGSTISKLLAPFPPKTK